MTGRLHIRLNELEIARVGLLADELGLNAQQAIKVLIKRATDELNAKNHQATK